MSEPIPACISIGGKLAAKRVSQLCAAIRAEGVSLDWGEAHFQLVSVQDLLDACQVINGTTVLWLCDDHANWGRFRVLEDFLVKHGIAFTLQADGKAEYDPDLIEFRPGHSPTRIITNAVGEPVISAKSLEPVKAALQQAILEGQKQRLAQCVTQLHVALARMKQALPPTVPQLPSFEIG